MLANPRMLLFTLECGLKDLLNNFVQKIFLELLEVGRVNGTEPKKLFLTVGFIISSSPNKHNIWWKKPRRGIRTRASSSRSNV